MNHEHGAYDLERTCGARVMNLSMAPRRRVRSASLAIKNVWDVEPYFGGVNYTVKVVPLTYLTRAAFHSRVLTRVLYDSAVGSLLHQFLYRLRRPEFFRSLIYRNTQFVE